jgi:uroporphyrinogen decarboxylase
MKFTTFATSAVLIASASAFTISPTLTITGQRSIISNSNTNLNLSAASTTENTSSSNQNDSSATTKDPLLIRAARGEEVERTPVWMMRQAGRHIAEYRELCKKWPTFRERSEIPEVAVEVSLQPWRNYKTDGCIFFSDILTPLPGMGVEFDISEKVGPIVEPMRDWDSVKKVSIELLFCLEYSFFMIYFKTLCLYVVFSLLMLIVVLYSCHCYLDAPH